MILIYTHTQRNNPLMMLQTIANHFENQQKPQLVCLRRTAHKSSQNLCDNS